MAEPFEVNDDTWQELVLDSDTPVMVDFWADWCAPCLALAPLFDQFADEFPKLTVAKVDIDSHPNILTKLGFCCIPTVIFFKDGEQLAIFIGKGPQQMQELVDAFNR